MKPTITTLAWVPDFARGFVRDLRPRWAFEEVRQPYEVELVINAKTTEHRARQPFGQVPTYADDEVQLFESGAIAIRIAERGTGLLPDDPAARARAIQWVIAALNSIEPWIMQMTAINVSEVDEPWTALRRDSVISTMAARLAELSAALGDKCWLDGDSFTVGDLVTISALGGLRKTNLLGGCPNLAAYVARGEARPAYRTALADHLAVWANAPASVPA